jgi:aminoglycoside phosphotransferase (APT) family kinase protein
VTAPDPGRLATFLRAELPAGQVEVSSVTPIAAGYSRSMFKVDAVVDGEKAAFVTRGDPPPEKSVIDTDRDQEWAVLHALTCAGDKPVAPARCYDGAGTVSGTRMIVSDFIESETLRTVLGRRDLDARPAQARRLAGVAAAIHATDLGTLGDALPGYPDWDAYLDARVEQWRAIERGHAESDPFIRYLAAWLDEHRPPPAPLRLVHGDFHAGNILVSPDGGFTAVDWEFARIADPREDLGWFTAIGASMPPDLVTEEIEVFCQAYRELTGLGADVINPWTISYFQILSGANLFGGVMAQASSLARGEVHNVKPIYVTGFIVTGHQGWFHGPQALENTALEDTAREAGAPT